MPTFQMESKNWYLDVKHSKHGVCKQGPNKWEKWVKEEDRWV
jgi:hypothetical protein